ncbi:NADPH:quinone reductase [Nakamurella panacisegetis]|uniref:NADPH:quinone reductase n=1 Tax=Nakamurella panacisegetis TaxID=1090615 RepID=A0A1H0IQS6_9ACTN|nr:zinc-binding alcohol dehydrogenase family protein [Nakamurella panacisegetis]SDO33807.1 NADPH:quinone reductase [Nakamurella panacisegetis]
MRAAVVTAFHTPPSCEEFPTPEPADGQVLIDVLASAIHPRVRSQADGSHYTSVGELPLIPGIDGVGRTADGQLRYFVLPDTNIGAMAEQTLIDPRRSVVLPETIDPIVIAAAMNPAMSSWIALRRRIDFRPGSRVLVMGATGNAGRMAVQIAKRLGASHVTAAGRDAEKLAGLAALGADTLINLGQEKATATSELAAVGRDVDVVVDYLWGEWAATALSAIVPARRDDAQKLTWIQVGSITGPESPIPSAALRACNLHIVGSGQGSVSPRDILAELPSLASEITSGHYDIAARAVPLARVTAAWADAAVTTDRLVVIPSAR